MHPQSISMFPDEPTTKRCPTCKQIQPLEAFSRNRSSKDGLQALCKPCHSASVVRSQQANRERYNTRQRAWYDKNTESQRVYHKDYIRERRFGINTNEYDAMALAQQHVCAICGRAETETHQNGTVRRLCIDHDHDTGRIRGLLCRKCNSMLGDAQDQPAVLRAAADYLERHNEPAPDARFIQSVPIGVGPATAERNGAYTRPDRRRRGETHGMAKLSPTDIDAVFAAAAMGESQRKIGVRFGVSQAQIQRILSGQSWKTDETLSL